MAAVLALPLAGVRIWPGTGGAVGPGAAAPSSFPGPTSTTASLAILRVLGRSAGRGGDHHRRRRPAGSRRASPHSATAHRLQWLTSGWPWLTPGAVNLIGYVLLGAATVVLLIGCLTAFPAALVPPSLQPSDMQMTANEYITAQNDARSTLVNALAGLLLLVTAIFTWRQLAISQEAQVTERYTRAVELLGNPDLARPCCGPSSAGPTCGGRAWRAPT